MSFAAVEAGAGVDQGDWWGALTAREAGQVQAVRGRTIRARVSRAPTLRQF
jgi:hypothetical protein